MCVLEVLEDNIECTSIMQKMDADEVIAVKSGDHILKLFLSFTRNIESIIHLTHQIVKDSTCNQPFCLTLHLKVGDSPTTKVKVSFLPLNCF